MKLSNAVLLSAILLLGASFAAAQERDGQWNNRDGYLQTVQYNNNADYQRGYQDGINSGRADANDGKRFDVENHPYYRNSNDEAYREGFKQGYREAYGEDHGGGEHRAGSPDYQRGFKDGVNSGRADASEGKRFDVERHPYYRDSHDDAYRQGFMQGYREGYGPDRR